MSYFVRIADKYTNLRFVTYPEAHPTRKQAEATLRRIKAAAPMWLYGVTDTEPPNDKAQRPGPL